MLWLTKVLSVLQSEVFCCGRLPPPKTPLFLKFRRFTNTVTYGGNPDLPKFPGAWISLSSTTKRMAKLTEYVVESATCSSATDFSDISVNSSAALSGTTLETSVSCDTNSCEHKIACMPGLWIDVAPTIFEILDTQTTVSIKELEGFATDFVDYQVFEKKEEWDETKHKDQEINEQATPSSAACQEQSISDTTSNANESTEPELATTLAKGFAKNLGRQFPKRGRRTRVNVGVKVSSLKPIALTNVVKMREKSTVEFYHATNPFQALAILDEDSFQVPKVPTKRKQKKRKTQTETVIDTTETTQPESIEVSNSESFSEPAPEPILVPTLAVEDTSTETGDSSETMDLQTHLETSIQNPKDSSDDSTDSPLTDEPTVLPKTEVSEDIGHGLDSDLETETQTIPLVTPNIEPSALWTHFRKQTLSTQDEPSLRSPSTKKFRNLAENWWKIQEEIYDPSEDPQAGDSSEPDISAILATPNIVVLYKRKKNAKVMSGTC